MKYVIIHGETRNIMDVFEAKDAKAAIEYRDRYYDYLYEIAELTETHMFDIREKQKHYNSLVLRI